MRVLRRLKSRNSVVYLGKRTVLAIIGASVVLFWIFWHICLKANDWSIDYNSPCILLWWTDTGAGRFKLMPLVCGNTTCFVTGDRRHLSRAKAILFYASALRLSDLPLPRKPGQIWALLHEESPRNIPVLLFEEAIQHFNYTSTFSRYSDFPLTTNELPSLSVLLDPKYVVSVGRKNVARAYLAPIVFIQSDCFTMSARTNYVEELMHHIPIDSYGSCLNNRKMPTSLRTDFLNKLYSEEISHFIGQYKFMISIENGICHDYITEKYWRPLATGVVPIYLGSPSIRDWEPHNNSAIYITDFKTPKELAQFIHELDSNDTEYVKYLYHKYNQIKPVINDRLTNEMAVRSCADNIFDNFQCQVLRALLAGAPNQKMANRRHYDCPLPIPYPTMEGEPMEIRDWNSIISKAKCILKALNEFIQIGRHFTRKELKDLSDDKMVKGLCE